MPWVPKRSDKTTWSRWHERVEKSVEARAHEAANEAIAFQPASALPADVEKEIWGIVREAEKSHA